jgi:hypothetical protein
MQLPIAHPVHLAVVDMVANGASAGLILRGDLHMHILLASSIEELLRVAMASRLRQARKPLARIRPSPTSRAKDASVCNACSKRSRANYIAIVNPRTTHREAHFTGSAAVCDVVIGMSDGLTVPFALAAGLSGAVKSSFVALVAGIAEMRLAPSLWDRAVPCRA